MRFAVLALTVACAGPDDPEPEPEGHNFLVIVLDDVGRDKVGVYNDLPDAPATPNLDALAAQGVVFGRYYTNMLCTPTRASLLTGMQGYDNGVPYHLWPWDPDYLDVSVTTLPEMLQGWSSTAIGKWHLGGLLDQAPEPPQAEAHGFDMYHGNPDNVGFRWEWDGQYESYVHYEYQDLLGWRTRDSYMLSDEIDDAVQAIERMREPWLLYVAPHAPHKPFEAPPAPLGRPGVTAASTDRERYDAMVEATDAEIGRLLDGMDADLRARTTIFVVSDNGTPLEVSGSADPWARAKNTPFEAGIRNPMIVAGAGVADPGRQVDALVSHTDLFATVAELAGVEAQIPEESRSFAPLLASADAVPTRDTVYVEYVDPRAELLDPWGQPTQGQGARDVRIVVGERYKLIRTPEADLLYDLETDPAERAELLAPLADEAQQALDALRAEASRHDLLAGR